MEVDSIAQHIPPTIENKSYSLLCDIVQPSGYHVMESIPQREESRSEHGTENEKGDMSLRNEENLPINDSSSLTWYSKEKLDHLSLTNQNGPSIIGSSPSLDGFSPACADEFSILSSSRREEIGMLSFNIYKIHIEPYTPFVLYDMFNSTDSGYLDHFSKFCIHLASVSSSTNQIPLSTIDLLFEVFKGYMEDDSRYIFDEVTLSFFLLLPLRIRISDNIVQKHLGMFNKFYEKNGNSLPINLLVGALTVDAFYSLLKGTWVLTTNTSILKEVSNFVGTLNKKCFNYHYLSVACFLYKLIMVVSNIKLSYEEQRIEMLHLEYEMLLWPAKLTRELSVVEDDLLATPEAFFLHVIHNTLLIEFYSNALRYKNKFGKMNSIFAVPGLYQFIAGMAKSNFRLNEGLVGRWSLIANCQLHTAKLLLGLYEVMEFEEFILALRFYKKSTNVFDYEFQDHIFSQVQKLLTKNSSYKLSDDDKDGPKVFWVFRDVRSMSLQLYIDESKERLH
ncbi:uncharacterized protein AC631_05653 [Debaryomyces fabryi]|uniref:Transcription factor domain-containing protein n=1 Tax=Debaryomyces fabryi TaxID=58627 RepID=A0A0V1PR74_9ASCO|nr:uncharacterized protein AC631_05653 [Debaryomyces fabryi]KRZ98587.1 hypothetical protein AC631_05653 [Debaryomyces fabryi]CUM57577.1 unnamed protein product [Debaryomyces fabryi]